MKALICTIAIGMFLFSNMLMAQDQSLENQKVKQENVSQTDKAVRGQNFIDENKNGVCDRFENAKPLGKVSSFVDANNNGICDNREKEIKRNGTGCGYRYRHGQQNGQGCGRGPCGGKGWKNR